MAETFDQQKTEAPTPRRREEARNEGQVAYSSELTGGLLLVTGVLILIFGGDSLFHGLLTLTRHYFSNSVFELDVERAQGVLTQFFCDTGGARAIPLGILVTVALAAGIMQAGFRMVPGILAPRWERLSPAAGSGRLFSLTAAVRGVIACCKIALLAAV